MIPSSHTPSTANVKGETPVSFHNLLFIIQIWVFPSLFKRGDYGVSCFLSMCCINSMPLHYAKKRLFLSKRLFLLPYLSEMF